MKKIKTLAGCLLALSAIYFSSCSNSSDSYYIQQLKDSIETLNNNLKKPANADLPSDNTVENASSLNQDETSNNESVGSVYEFTDAEGTKWKLNLNNDESATLDANGKIYYGSWKPEDGGVYLCFHELPRIVFPDSFNMDSLSMKIVGDYIYVYNYIKSKNPRKRLSIHKIK